MNIQESLRKIKSKALHTARILDRRDTYAVLTVIFTSLASFYLGKLSEIESASPGVSIERGEQAAQSAHTREDPIKPPNPVSEEPKPQVSTSPPTQAAGLYVASKSSKKYHLPTCPGAKMISEANKIWFSSREEAEKAGYSPAGNCKGF